MISPRDFLIAETFLKAEKEGALNSKYITDILGVEADEALSLLRNFRRRCRTMLLTKAGTKRHSASNKKAMDEYIAQNYGKKSLPFVVSELFGITQNSAGNAIRKFGKQNKQP